MIDHEKNIYTLVSEILKQEFESIETTNQKLRFYKLTYPVVSLVQTNNYVLEEGRIFGDYESMNREEYEIEVQSTKDIDEVKSIIYIVDDSMRQLGYVRTYCGLDTEDKETELKRLVQYQTAN